MSTAIGNKIQTFVNPNTIQQQQNVAQVSNTNLFGLTKPTALQCMEKIADFVLQKQDGTANMPHKQFSDFMSTGKETVVVEAGIACRAIPEMFNESYTHNPNNPLTVQDNGFCSRNDLNTPKNKIEASGIGIYNSTTGNYESVGATGQSGVSCAKTFDGAKNYGTTMYFIDISKIGGTEKAFDMKATVIANDPTKTNADDATGGEINITNVPPEAIIGYMYNRRENDEGVGDKDLEIALEPDDATDPNTQYGNRLLMGFASRTDALTSCITINPKYIDSF